MSDPETALYDTEPPDYDETLEAALDTLDEYQSARARMDTFLKTAFFDLARSKQALGPSRVGPASFNLSRIEPIVTVDILTNPADVPDLRLAQAKPYRPETSESKKGKEKEFKAIDGIVDLRLTASKETGPSGTSDSAAKGSSKSNLRSRLTKRLGKPLDAGPTSYTMRNDNDSAKEKTPSATSQPARIAVTSTQEDVEQRESLPPPYADAINEYLLDPIQQFSAFPPVTLRNSQRAFRQALEQALKVIKAQQEYARLCSVVEESHVSKKI